MKIRAALATTLLLTLAMVTPARPGDTVIKIVAAENFYGDVARQIGGERVSVTSILNNPDQDPHLFEISPSVARQVAAAQIVIGNGADYDPWLTRLFAAAPKSGRVVIIAADLMHRKAGDNPHLWYDPSTMPTVAEALAAALSQADPGHRDQYALRLRMFLSSLEPLNKKIREIADRYSGVAVAATEPVFNDMAAALKLVMHYQRFQLAVMNDTEPGAGAVAEFERGLRSRTVRVLFYNTQTTNAAAQHLIDLARASSIPVVGVSETAPAGVSYQDWILRELDATERALAGQAA